MNRAKPVMSWEEFQKEARRHMWWQLRLEHRREGCLACKEGGCLATGADD